MAIKTLQMVLSEDEQDAGVWGDVGCRLSLFLQLKWAILLGLLFIWAFLKLERGANEILRQKSTFFSLKLL